MIFGKEGTRLIGKTSQISQESKTFVLKTENETWKVVWDDKTNFIADGKKATPDDLKDDVEVMVAGKPVGEEITINSVFVDWFMIRVL
jgi:putative N-acetylmannosamine-6-phosphate epimerase